MNEILLALAMMCRTDQVNIQQQKECVAEILKCYVNEEDTTLLNEHYKAVRMAKCLKDKK